MPLKGFEYWYYCHVKKNESGKKILQTNIIILLVLLYSVKAFVYHIYLYLS